MRPRACDALCVAVLLATACSASAQSLEELSRLSVEDLASIEITSVSKRPEALSQAAAAVYVITADEIRRSGVTSLAEALRLAPNLEVARISSQTYAISSRGMNSVNASNKLLVLIDGRSVYTPFFGSVFWDQQDTMIADIERIEVISGPGGTLWGSNAMNGVVNVITKGSAETQGGLLDAKAGNFVSRAAGRWGGALPGGGTYRVYALGFRDGDTRLVNGTNADDAWTGRQAGFRSELAVLDGSLSVIGDAYENRIDSSGRRSGGDVLARWARVLDGGGVLQLQGYFDEQNRSDTAAGGSATDSVRTWDFQLQHGFGIGAAQQIVWGAGYRIWTDEFRNGANPFVLVPESETLSITNLFVQDTIGVSDDLKVTLGLKLEYSTFSQWAVMPSVRVGWQVAPDHFLWGAISRAVRTPSRIERDLYAPGIVDPSPDFASEKLVAYEAGWRSRLLPQATVSVSLFYNDYDDLRTTSPNPVTVLPVTFGNGWQGATYGLDAWATWTPLPWWRVVPGVEILRKRFDLKPGEQDIAGTQSVLGHDPGHQVFLRSFMDLPDNWELYVGLRQIGALPAISVPSYFEADVKVAYRPSPNVELALVGQNLVHAYHAEGSQPSQPIHEIPRSWYAGIRWKF
jgi:iron complex outermembrane receptor protein